MGNLLIFIDGLPYHYLHKTRFLSHFEHQNRVAPGIGFSVNIKPEMYSGRNPDQVGYFGEYGLQRGAGARWQRRLSFLHFVRRWPEFDRLVHKALIRAGFDVLNIPFGYLSYFTRVKSKSVYASDFPFPTLFTQTNTEYVAAELMPRSSVPRDRQVYETAMTQLENRGSRNLHLSFIGLDEAGHAHGVGTRGYDRALEQIEEWVEGLQVAFRRSDPGGNIIVFSDHGMVNVARAVDVDLESYLGPSSPATYTYFLDSVMLRLWTDDKQIYEEAFNLLQGLEHGKILSSDLRREYGVTASFCGDLIFVAAEGGIFSPNYFGLKRPKAMHGYLPHLDSQQAVLLASGSEVRPEHLVRVRNTKDIYHYLMHLCQT